MNPDPVLDGLYSELAGRFGALSKLFGQLSSPKAAQDLIAGLTSEKDGHFKLLTDQLDIPMLGKCVWLREIIERVVSTSTGFATECWLRDDLTPAERLVYLRIAWRNMQVHRTANPVLVRNGRTIIPPGPFLDELRANGLVHCENVPTYESSLTLTLSRPERICL